MEKKLTTGGRKEPFRSKTSTVLFFLKGSKHYFLLCVLFSMGVSFFDMTSPKIIGYMVDSVIGDKQSSLPSFVDSFIEKYCGGRVYLAGHLWIVALFVVVIAVLAAVCRFMMRVSDSKGSEKLVERMRNELSDHLLHLPFSWYNDNHTGDIIQRSTSDVDTVRRFVSEQLTQLLRISIMIIFAMTFMAQINGRLALYAFLFIPVIVCYSMFFHNRIAASFRQVDEEEGRLSAIAQENLTGVRVVRAFGREAYERERFAKKNEQYTSFWVRLQKLLAAFWGSGNLISGLQVLTITVTGAVFCVHGQITAGEYIAFVTYNSMLTWPVRAIGRVISDMSKAGISIERIREIMSSPTEKYSSRSSEEKLSGDISFSHVSFSYRTKEAESPEVLDDINFTIKEGQTVGILGGTGSGKSTLMYLLDRLYELPEGCGKITIGGRDIKDIDLETLRGNIGMVLQEPYLFSMTLGENIAIARKNATQDDVLEATKMACLDRTIDRFAEKYDTFVGERGVTLSGGQKQRAAIAQTLIRKPPVMVFDDSLSAVDAQTDARIRHALDKGIKDSTVILIAHRITTLMNADQIIVLDKGRVAEQGTHEELLAKNGIYRKIYDLQLAGAKAE